MATEIARRSRRSAAKRKRASRPSTFTDHRRVWGKPDTPPAPRWANASFYDGVASGPLVPYVYGANDPVSKFDPTGLIECDQDGNCRNDNKQGLTMTGEPDFSPSQDGDARTWGAVALDVATSNHRYELQTIQLGSYETTYIFDSWVVPELEDNAATLGDYLIIGALALVTGGLIVSTAGSGAAIGAAARAAPPVLAGDRLTRASERGSRLAARGLDKAVRLGRAGEAAAGIVKNTSRIQIPGGGYRIPDVLDRTVRLIGEVKNVQSLSYTAQLRDYATYAQTYGYRFELWVRESTYLSAPLREAIAGKQIFLRRLP